MKRLSFSITLLLLSTLAFGQVPNTFSSGETISSSKINANFSFLADSLAKGNLTAIIHCFGSASIIDLDNLDNWTQYATFTNPSVAYNNCISTDNVSFISNAKTCPIGYFDFLTYECEWPPSSHNQLVSINEIFSDNWIQYSNSGHIIFYKVSSD